MAAVYAIGAGATESQLGPCTLGFLEGNAGSLKFTGDEIERLEAPIPQSEISTSAVYKPNSLGAIEE